MVRYAMGQSVPRTEDPRLLKGIGRYLDDIRVSIDHNAPEVGDVVVHLPIAGYQIQPCD